MRHSLFSVLLTGACLAGAAHAASLDGTQWRTYDDNGTPKSVVQFKANGGSYDGTVVQLLKGATMTKCTTCTGADKNRPIVGLTVVRHLKESGKNTFDGGEVFDPKNGKTYKMKGTLSADGKTLEMRGFVGISLLGRTQKWHRVN